MGNLKALPLKHLQTRLQGSRMYAWNIQGKIHRQIKQCIARLLKSLDQLSNYKIHFLIQNSIFLVNPFLLGYRKSNLSKSWAKLRIFALRSNLILQLYQQWWFLTFQNKWSLPGSNMSSQSGFCSSAETKLGLLFATEISNLLRHISKYFLASSISTFCHLLPKYHTLH